MTLESCPACEHEVSDSCLRCPHCGHEMGNVFERVVRALIFLAMFLVSLGLVAFGFTKLTIATQGVGAIALGIWVAICIRLLQASYNKH
ncbi:MAG TPA: hypothetical protein VFJ01_06185 [Oleiagrimonas sp.]|nr:hypothetical protein [Oleiagrimonas sp.]